MITDLTPTDDAASMLITGGAIVSMDPAIEDLPRGDVLIVGSVIAAVGADLASDPRLAAPIASAERIDASGCIVSPGFVDTHRHAWQTQLRRSMPDVDDLGAYVMAGLCTYAPEYTPFDMYVGTRLAALTALDAGITTMLDFSHNSRTATHSDAAIEALFDSGIRGVHASMGPHFGAWDRQWPADLERMMGAHRNGPTERLTFRLAALATDEIAGPSLAYRPELAGRARDLGIWTSIDAVFGSSSSAAVLEWARLGILDPTLTLIHCTGLTTDAWKAMGDAGVTVSLAPTSDAQIGLESAVPAVDESLAVGIRPGLSIDVEIALASDMFTQMRALLTIQRMRVTNRAYVGEAVPAKIVTRDVLRFATIDGARTNGLQDVTGSLTPGKKADLIVTRADDINNMPLNDAVGTLVLGADARNIEVVIVDGIIRKRDGKLVDLDLDQLRADVVESRDALVRRATA
ncbi:MAG: amidohydrolase family protein [Rhodococcus sp. (in: high G+C Gram-positive bacteria)]